MRPAYSGLRDKAVNILCLEKEQSGERSQDSVIIKLTSTALLLYQVSESDRTLK
jgi:hypothetical protein